MARERCAFCGALNPDTATWCGQCLRQFPPSEMAVAPLESPANVLLDDLEALPEIAESERSNAVAAAAPAQSEVGGRGKTGGKRVQRGAFTVTEEGITWKCQRCETTNPLEAQYCGVCGASFAEMLRPKADLPQRDPNMAALVSLFLPGAGHMYMKLWSQGIARAVISVWVLSVVGMSLLAGGRGASTLVAVVFGVVATGLWVLGAHDAYREARGEPKLAVLKGKAFLYLVLGLLMLLFFLLLGAGLNARAA